MPPLSSVPIDSYHGHNHIPGVIHDPFVTSSVPCPCCNQSQLLDPINLNISSLEPPIQIRTSEFSISVKVKEMYCR